MQNCFKFATTVIFNLHGWYTKLLIIVVEKICFYRDVKVCMNILNYIKQTIQGQPTLVSQYVIKSYPFGSRNLRGERKVVQNKL